MIETEELKKKDAILAEMLGEDNEESFQNTVMAVRSFVDRIISERPDKTRDDILRDIHYALSRCIVLSGDAIMQTLTGDLLLARNLLIADEYLTEKGY